MGGNEDEVTGETNDGEKVAERVAPSMGAEIHRNFHLYAVFHGAWFMLRIVNQLEQTFARALVECKTPVDPNAMFTGSAWCGDRLYVIDQGQKLSSRGQGLEFLFKVVAMVFLAILADIVGRKAVLVIGIACTGVSALCFLVAIASPSWLAFTLFVLGQGLQGAYPAELLAALITNDVSSEKESDLVTVQSVSAALGFVNVFGQELLGAILKSIDSTDFRLTWVLVLMINVGLAIWAVAFFRETKPTLEVDRANSGILQGAKDEIQEYWTLLRTRRTIQWNMLAFACFAAFFTGMTIDFSFYISYFGISQTSAAMHFFWKFPVGAFFFPAAETICDRLGYRKGYMVVLLVFLAMDIVFMPFFLVSPVVYMLYQYAITFGGGMPVIAGAIDARWFDQQVTSKYLSMKALVEFVSAMIANPLYGQLFDAHATGYVRRMAPYFFMFTCKALAMLIQFGPLWHPEGLPQVLDRVEKERREAKGQAARPSKPETKSTDEKKTD